MSFVLSDCVPFGGMGGKEAKETMTIQGANFWGPGLEGGCIGQSVMEVGERVRIGIQE